MRNFRVLVSAAALSAACAGAPDDFASDEASANLVASSLAQAPALAAGSASDTFVVRDYSADGDGTQHVRMERYHGGLRVIGGDLVAHATRKGSIQSVSHTLDRTLSPRKVRLLDEAGAAAIAAKRLQGTLGAQFDESTEQVIYARNGTQTLAFDVLVEGDKQDGAPLELHQIIDAETGALLDQWDGIETTAAAGTGKGFFSGARAITVDKVSATYSLRDPSRGSTYTTNMKSGTTGNGTIFTNTTGVFGTGLLAAADTAAADAQIGTAYTWDYYKSTHGRNGIANDGKGAFNRVHYGSKYSNAYWSDSCFCMTYGDGDGSQLYPLTSIDVAGHEMSHGVTSRTAKLVYSGESGGLNEATSDIFGTMVEFYANLSNDTPDYLIGEKLFIANGNKATSPETSATKAIRYMWKPSLDGKSADCWSASVGSLDVHYSSGVGNHLYYLLAEGSAPTNGHPASPTCNGAKVTGVGRAAAEKIWYRALTVYMTSSTNYSGARAACIKAATDLYGATSTQVTNVKAAWAAVNVTK
jgi:Zn-dependent metalloprotease